MSETWRDIPGLEGMFQASDQGRVRNAQTKAVVAATPDKDGYRVVMLRTEAGVVNRKVHRLVLLAFVGAPPNGEPEADHINRERADNRLANLRWASRSLNHLNAAARGKSGVRGVRYRSDKPNPWQAYAGVGGRFKSLGHFPTADGAIAARKKYEEARGV